MKKTFVLLFLFSLCFKIYSQKTLVFVGSFNRDKNTEGIYVYELDTLKGKLIKKFSVKGFLNPSFLTISQDGKYLYACTESKTKNDGSVSSFAIDSENSSLTFINSQKSGGENPVYLSVHRNGKWLINGNYTEGSISVFPLAANGSISPPVQNIHYQEGSINPHRQERSHIHATVFSPGYNYVIAPDLGADKLRIFDFDETQDQPLKNDSERGVKATLGSGPRHFTFHPNGQFGYAIEEMGGAVSVYNVNNGRLEVLQRIFTHPETKEIEFESSDIHLSPDGKYLYATNRGSENNIAIFAVRNDGSLETVGYQAIKGKQTRAFAIDESGKFLITTNAGTGDITVFKRNPDTGLLKKIGKKVKIKGASSIQIRNY